MDKTILIVDDEIDLSAMLKRYFELNGYKILKNTDFRR